ncbi:MAG: hypothetical protein HYS21_14155 [Deltaproteobacteria bacterium]|nr:hypothetical protein [Deltaproteobacteria bacterium]
MEWPLKLVNFSESAVIIYGKKISANMQILTIDRIEGNLALVIGDTICIPLNLLDLTDAATYRLFLAGGGTDPVKAEIFGTVELNAKTIGKISAYKELFLN